eukprot:s2709_g1.t1
MASASAAAAGRNLRAAAVFTNYNDLLDHFCRFSQRATRRTCASLLVAQPSRLKQPSDAVVSEQPWLLKSEPKLGSHGSHGSHLLQLGALHMTVLLLVSGPGLQPADFCGALHQGGCFAEPRLLQKSCGHTCRFPCGSRGQPLSARPLPRRCSL